MGGEPEPRISHFVGTAAVVCPKACSCLLAYGFWRHSALSLVSCASAVEVEGHQCLHPDCLTAAFRERRLTFLLSSTVVALSLSPLPNPAAGFGHL